jgi:hypothetical protein
VWFALLHLCCRVVPFCLLLLLMFQSYPLCEDTFRCFGFFGCGVRVFVACDTSSPGTQSNVIFPRCWFFGWIVSGRVELLHVGHKTGLMCTTVYLWCHNHLFCIRPGFMSETFFCVACILVEVVWSYRLLLIAVFWLSTNCRPH